MYIVYRAVPRPEWVLQTYTALHSDIFRVKTVVHMKMCCKNDINIVPVKAAIALQPGFHLIHRQAHGGKC